MGKKQHKSHATKWTSGDIRKVETWLKSSAGVKSIGEVSARSCDTVKVINDMIVIDPSKLREPYTI